MSDMNVKESTSVAISNKRMNGLRYKAEQEERKLGYRVQYAPLLDKILDKAGIQELTDDEFNKLMKKLEVA